ncbi:MAG: helix-hairpin-helix domain-containing protein [Firmicutes bacterium]|nr:helix-hairpin-helix domain-containing protein [Bacillota bacterium]
MAAGGDGPSRRKLFIIIGVLLVLAGLGGFRYALYLAGSTSSGSRAVPAEQQAEIAVHVKGAVAGPGLYWLPAGSRVGDAVEAAGGAVSGADLEQLNLAAFVSDGSQLYVPYLTEQSSSSSSSSSGLININTATQAELETLDGIGESKARAIIAYREEHGSFATVEQLTRVSGIGESTLAKIKDQICAY